MNTFLKASKIAGAVFLAFGVSSATHAANDTAPRYLMNLKVEGQAKIQEWTTINHLYTSWANQGGVFDCSEWVANTATIDWGTQFQQSRTCSQGQTRTATPVLFNAVLKTTKTGVSFQETRTIKTAQFQVSIGARDFINGESVKEWSAWSNDGSHYGCDAWAPLPETVNLYETFEQSRSCSQNQTRNRNVMDVWASGLETLKRTENDAQVLSEVEKQPATGTKNFIASTRTGEWSVWADIGEHYGCAVWSPAVDTVNLQDSFTQTRSCSQDQTAERTIYDVWRDGAETVNREETKTQTISETESQPAVGTKDYITTTREGEWTAWSNNGAHYNCGTWSPAVNTVNLGEAFNQTRSCSQNQVRQRDIYNVWKSGAETLKVVEPDAQTISETETQPATGSKDYIAGSRAGEWSAWTIDGAPYDCGPWSPDVSTVNLEQRFTQSRTCSQKQNNGRTIYDVWASSNETVNRTEAGTQTIRVTQNQGATGTKDFVTGVSYGGWSDWVNSGTPFSCGGWSPAVTTVNLGDGFTQTRNCTQTQTHVRDVFDVYKSGEQVNTGTDSGSQNISVTQSQPATGTKDYIVTTRIGEWGDWSNSGTMYACGTWSPSTGTYDLSVVFTQTRSCSQDQARSRTIYNVWKSGNETVKNTEPGTKTISVTDSQSAVGTRDYDTGNVEYGQWSTWSNSGSPYSCGSWSPATSTVNLGAGFTQSQNCSQNQTRTRSIHKVWASGHKEPAGTDTGSQTISVTQMQPATGSKDYVTGTAHSSWSDWTNAGGLYACGSWSPSTSSVSWGQSFTQTASCSQKQTQSRTVYDVWASGNQTGRTTEKDSRVIVANPTRVATGTYDYVVNTTYGGWSDWSYGGLYNCGGWSPSTSTVNLGQAFTQSRSCSRDQSRSRAITNHWASGGTSSGGTGYDRTTASVTDNQPATGSRDYVTGTSYGGWSGWSNSGGPYNCGTWSPDPSTVDRGASFTQTQYCSQNQTQSRAVYSIWASGASTPNGSDSASQTISVSRTQGSTGTRNFVTGSESSAGAWLPVSNLECDVWQPGANSVNNGVTFTQSRTCHQAYRRTVTVYTVWADGYKTVANTYSEDTTTYTPQTQSATGTKSVGYSWTPTGNNYCAYVPTNDFPNGTAVCTSPGATFELVGTSCWYGGGNLVMGFVCQ